MEPLTLILICAGSLLVFAFVMRWVFKINAISANQKVITLLLLYIAEKQGVDADTLKRLRQMAELE